jgi:hypothetical protein
VREAFDEALRASPETRDPAEATPHAALLAEHGMWLPSALGTVRRRAIDEVVRPALAALLQRT